MPVVWTNAGQEWVVDRIDPGASPTGEMRFLAWGTGSTVPAVGQTALVTESAEARVSCTVSQPAADTLRRVGTLETDSNQGIQEAGIFNQIAVAGSIMNERATHNVLNLEYQAGPDVGDRIEYTFDLQFKDSSE